MIKKFVLNSQISSSQLVMIKSMDVAVLLVTLEGVFIVIGYVYYNLPDRLRKNILTDLL